VTSGSITLRCVAVGERRHRYPKVVAGRALLVLAATAVAAGIGIVRADGPATGAGAAVTTGTVSGTVWHDLDADGTRDAGEPGIRRVTITRLGTTATTVTGADGRWTLSLPSGTATISALTGWLPSACPGDLQCAAGRTTNQRFAVENQFVRARVNVTAGGAITGLDLGLEPDHGDPTGRPTSLHRGNDRGDGTALSHDLAVRHSGEGYAGCADPSGTRVCPVGARITGIGQIYNQGLAWVTDVRFVVTVPPGTTLRSDPVLDRATPGTKPTRTGRSGPTAEGGRWIEFVHPGLPPATALWFRTTFEVTGGPSSPKPYGSGAKADRKAYVSISQVTPRDNDSTLLVDPRTGRDLGHTVNGPQALDDDTSDAIEFNVA
jgi:hypothetical protein